MSDQPLTDYDATMIAEGVQDGDQTAAWAHLIRTGLCWKLQGRFGRTARDLIAGGYIAPDGTILKPLDHSPATD